MSAWILIVWIWSMNPGGVAITNVEFSNQKDCKTAGEMIKKGRLSADYVCVESKDTKSQN